ncbi:hypothetical protein HK405_002360, partial [Cladochytrium tenue]
MDSEHQLSQVAGDGGALVPSTAALSTTTDTDSDSSIVPAATDSVDRHSSDVAGGDDANDAAEPVDAAIEELTRRPAGTAYSLTSSELRQRRIYVREYAALGARQSAAAAAAARRVSQDAGGAGPASTSASASTAGAASAAPAESSGAKLSGEDDGSSFECNICLDAVAEPVVSLCG